MKYLIQYKITIDAWSDWCEFENRDGKFIVNEEEVNCSYVRFLKYDESKFKPKPYIAWCTFYQEKLYQVTWCNSRNGVIVTDVDNTNAKLLNPGLLTDHTDFTLENFNQMRSEAEEYLKPLLFNVEQILSLIVRPADDVERITLEAEETSETRITKWWKNLYEKYRLDVERKLREIISSSTTKAQQITKIREFLSENYNFIERTCLSYLAIPNHPVTKTLSFIAQEIEKTSEIPAIQLLMPDVYVESAKENHESLSTLDLSYVLRSHIALSKEFLMPVTSLFEYIEAPTEDLYSPYTYKDELYQQASQQDIEALFKHSKITEALRDAFQEYQNLSLSETHLLGQLNLLTRKLTLYDAHGGIGRQEDAAGGAYSAILNFFQYYLSLEPCTITIKETGPNAEDLLEGDHLGYVFSNDSLYFITKYENCTITRLTQPDTLAKSVETDETPQRFAKIFKERFTESKRLTIEELCFIDAHTGHFFVSGYAKVPADIRNEIELLWQLAHNPAKNIDATRNMATCIGTRRETMQKLTKQYDSELIKVTVNPKEQKNLLEKAKENLQVLKDAFMEEINSGSYQGCDTHPGLTTGIIKRYQPTISIQSFSDCYLLSRFKPNDLQLLLTEQPELIQALKLHLGNPEEYLIYLSETPLATLEITIPHTVDILRSQSTQIHVIIECIGPEKGEVLLRHVRSIITKFKDFHSLLKNIDHKQRSVLLKEMKEKLPAIIKSPEDFYYTLRDLNEEQISAVYEVMQYELPIMIEDISDFFLVLRRLNNELFSAACEEMKEKLSTIIKNGSDFNFYARKYLNKERCSALCKAMINSFPAIIKTAWNFYEALENLDEEPCSIVYESMKQKLPTIIKNSSDFGYVLKYLNAKQCSIVCEEMKGQLFSTIIKSANDFNNALQCLNKEQCSAICEAMKERLPSIITNVSDFRKALQYLNKEQCSAICEAMKETLPSIITNVSDFRKALQYLNKEQCSAICEAMEATLPSIITNASDFREALRDLNEAQRSVVYEAMKETLPSIITNVSDFRKALQYLNKEQCSAICEAMEATLPSIITNASDFREALRDLNEAQRSVVYEAMKERLPSIITNVSDFRKALQYLNKEQCSAICEAMEATLPSIITNASDFREALRDLNEAQRSVVYEAMKETLPTIIKNASDFREALRDLNEAQRSAVCEAMEATLLSIITNASDFHEALRDLNEAQRSVVYEAMKETLPTIIKSANDFRAALLYLNEEQCSAVCEAMKETLPTIIKSASDFREALRDLNEAQRSAVYEAMKETLPTIIKSASDFRAALLYLNEEQCSAICEAMEATLPSIITNVSDFREALRDLNEAQRSAVIDSLKKNLRYSYTFLRIAQGLSSYEISSIKNSSTQEQEYISDFNQCLHSLDEYQKNAINKAMENIWSTSIQEQTGESSIFSACSIKQCATILYGMFPQLIKSSGCFTQVLNGIYHDNHIPNKNLDIENGDTNLNIPEGKITDIKTKLQKYIERAEKSQKNYKIDFSYGFYFFQRSRSISRKINYFIALKLLQDLDSNGNTSFCLNVMEKINNYKALSKNLLDYNERRDYVDRGINSSELNVIIRDLGNLAR